MRNQFQLSQRNILRKLALADGLQMRMQMQISVLLCRFGCKFLQSYADLDADSIFVYIILQYFASLCINPYNSAYLDANFCVVTHILTRLIFEILPIKLLPMLIDYRFL